jgi:hypothetical protein
MASIPSSLNIGYPFFFNAFILWNNEAVVLQFFFFTHFIISIAVLENVPLSTVTEKSHFSTLNVGLARTGNRTRATCMAGSVSRRSAIHYPTIRPLSFPDFVPVILSPGHFVPGHFVPWSSRPLLSHHLIQFHMCKIIQFYM